MVLPEQIRKQDEAVQELYRQLAEDGEGNEKDVAQDVSPEEPEVEARRDSELADDTAEETASSPPAKSDDEGVDVETIQQKYRTLQGMYNAEVPRLHRQNKELETRLQSMEQLIASMQKQSEAAPAKQASPEKFISEEDVAEYGDSIDVMRRVSREELSSVTGRLMKIEEALQNLQGIAPKVQEVAQRQAASAEQQFWAELTNAVPNWREINDNQDFQTWLLEHDPLTGKPRQAYLEDAQQQLNAARVASFFTTWVDSTGQTTPQTPAPSNSSRKASQLEKQVSPGRSRSTGAPAANKGRVWTPTDISEFFREVREGRFQGREKERDQLERDIFAAQREGRIRNDA